MGQSEWELESARIRQRMGRLRRKIDGDVEEIVTQAQSLLDWRNQVRQHPWAAAGAAAALGFFLMPGRRVTPQIKLHENTIAELARQSQPPPPVQPAKPVKQPFLQGALVALAGMAMRQAVSAASLRIEQYIHEIAKGRREQIEPRRPSSAGRPLHGAN